MIRLQDIIAEAPYTGNLGFEEMMKFYEVATQREISQLEKFINDDKDKKAWKFVQKVTGMKLKGKDSN